MKKLQICLLVVVIIAIVALSGCTSSNNSSNNSSSNNSSSSNVSNASAAGDVTVVVSYSGPWAVDVSGPFGHSSFSGTGEQTNNIGSVTGSVTAAARKTDGSNGVLTVSIIKNGKTLASQSTNAPYGGATAVATGI